MGFLKKLFGKKSDSKQSDAQNAYNDAIQNLKQSGVYDEISSISKSKKQNQSKEQEGSNFSSFVGDLIKTGKELQDARISEIQERHDTAATQGKLPAPDIVGKYDCECGSNNTFHIKNMNLEGGLDVQCAHCGAILHVPPTILYHSEYWSAGGGASLVPNWRDQLKFVKHGKQKK